jgi:hypothetical protein
LQSNLAYFTSKSFSALATRLRESDRITRSQIGYWSLIACYKENIELIDFDQAGYDFESEFKSTLPTISLYDHFGGFDFMEQQHGKKPFY